MNGTKQIQCSEPNCRQPATAHSTLLIARSVVSERYFCDPHCQDYFKSSLNLIPRAKAMQRITPGAVECDVSHILTRPESATEFEQQYFYLRESAGCRGIGLLCGTLEVAMMLKSIKFPHPARPTPFDLVAELADALSASLDYVLIDEFSPTENVYLASVAVKSSDGLQFIDARPSDAISLAIRRSLPIFVSENILAGKLRMQDRFMT